ncbi:hypothetical protein CEXT_146681 [Caerostris extrusa]|uniref:Uncharacterized protein n=1 Tax=Caerostris extrusa TaxID=172846 RepID=A0AAV4QWM3_CAEEX|nr:hypothetical protein CEXT_146681 [Caerostris extrusa]
MDPWTSGRLPPESHARGIVAISEEGMRNSSGVNGVRLKTNSQERKGKELISCGRNGYGFHEKNDLGTRPGVMETRANISLPRR